MSRARLLTPPAHLLLNTPLTLVARVLLSRRATPAPRRPTACCRRIAASLIPRIVPAQRAPRQTSRTGGTYVSIGQLDVYGNGAYRCVFGGSWFAWGGSLHAAMRHGGPPRTHRYALRIDRNNAPESYPVHATGRRRQRLSYVRRTRQALDIFGPAPVSLRGSPNGGKRRWFNANSRVGTCPRRTPAGSSRGA